MKRQGVDQIFFAGTSLIEMADYVRKHYGKPRKKRATKSSRPDLVLARELTKIEDAPREKVAKSRNSKLEIRAKRASSASPARAARARRR